MKTVKVAVVGSGLAGLTAAHLLTRKSDSNVSFEVHLFEKSPSVGMDSESISIKSPDSSKEWRIDVPMRSFQGGPYPRLIELYQNLGVVFKQADFTYAFSSFNPLAKARKLTTFLIYNGVSGRRGVGIPTTICDKYANKTNFFRKSYAIWLFVITLIQIIACYIWTLPKSAPFWREDGLESMTFGEWAERITPTNFVAKFAGMDHAWRNYAYNVLVPLFSAVCTVSETDIINHPVEELLDYIWLTLGTHHYTIVNGVRDVVQRLATGVHHIYVSAPIIAIKPDSEDVQLASVHYLKGDKLEAIHGFHHVIFATQARHAVPLLKEYMTSIPSNANSSHRTLTALTECLKAFEYRPTIVVNHTDDSLLPDDKRDRRDINLTSVDWRKITGDTFSKQKSPSEYSLCMPTTYTMATHVLPRPEGYPDKSRNIYQTTNPIFVPKEETLLSVTRLDRAVMSVKSKKALKRLFVERRKYWQCAGQGDRRLGDLQGAGRLEDGKGPGIWICGAYVYPGIPLLEGCVTSAQMVVRQGIFYSEGIKDHV